MKDIEYFYGNGEKNPAGNGPDGRQEEMPLSEAIEREAMKAAGMLDEKTEAAGKADAENVSLQAKALAQKERELAERERALRERELQIRRERELQIRRNSEAERIRRAAADTCNNTDRPNGSRQPFSEDDIRDTYRNPGEPDIYINESDLEDDEDPGYEKGMRRNKRNSKCADSGNYRNAQPQRGKKQPGKDKKQARKEAKRKGKDTRSGRGRDGGRKKKHPFRNFLLILLVIFMIPVAYILMKFWQMHIGGLSVSDLKSYISEEVKNSAKSGAMAGYKNIALFGVDSIEGSLDSGNNRTDIMIIASINEKTGDVKLVSLYRDTYLDIGDGNYQKANAAFAYGGPEQAINMLNTNLDLNISDYVVTGFEGIATAIDAVGGIDIDVSEEEIHYMNDYQSTMAEETGMTYVPVTQAGLQTLTGLQATAYCRIRYTEGGDFKRTERQKEVLSKTFDKLKSSGPLTMVKVADAVMSKVRTSLNMTEIAAMAAQAMNYHIADTNGIPVEQFRTVGYIGDQSCVIPVHLTDNVKWLHEYLFNDSEYQVSSTVQQISDHVSAVSGK